jgi:phosphatidylethanolamine-binding protein (PEBP) family uncharacterized protein
MLGVRHILAITAGALLFAGAAHAAEVFTITSSAFKDGALLPKKIAGDNKANPNCVGENVSPPACLDERAPRHHQLCAGHDRS